MYGDLPDARQLREWEETVMRHSALPVPVIAAIEALPHDAHPMGVILAGLNALSTFHPEQNPALQGGGIYRSHDVQDKQIVRIIGKMTTLAAHAYHRNTGRTPAHPNQTMGYAENFLYMLDAGLDPNHRPNPRLAKALDVMFLLHAEHEMNCSTAAARHLASSGVDVYSAVAGAVGALYGPLHGGANEAVLKMLARIGNKEAIPAFLKRVKDKKEKMFGFGHRVYKNFDPRANVIREVAEEVFRLVGRDPLIDVAVELEKAARQDEYFVQRKLYPNVDFYSGLVYRALGFPPEFFTVLFAVPRAAGYLAHWRESLTDPDAKIARPQQVYQGEWLRAYPALAARPPRALIPCGTCRCPTRAADASRAGPARAKSFDRAARGAAWWAAGELDNLSRTRRATSASARRSPPGSCRATPRAGWTSFSTRDERRIARMRERDGRRRTKERFSVLRVCIYFYVRSTKTSRAPRPHRLGSFRTTASPTHAACARIRRRASFGSHVECATSSSVQNPYTSSRSGSQYGQSRGALDRDRLMRTKNHVVSPIAHNTFKD